jgi:acyl-CoA reductase-like NAD-dependent aldehyde dehydrogenase
MCDRFVEAFLAETYKLQLGDPTTDGTSLGPVVNSEAAKRIRMQVDRAIEMGAQQVSDDARFSVPDLSDCYLPPRVLLDVTHKMALMTEETFGPAIGIMPYDTLDEGIRLVNDSRYGLTASIWSTDMERALSMGPRLAVGTVYLNRCDAVDADLPWIGVKDSGLGATLSREGIVSFTRPKSYNFKVG